MQEKMQGISEAAQTELKKLEEEMNEVLRGMCRTSPPVLFMGDLKAAM